jgi:hypothetical protein
MGAQSAPNPPGYVTVTHNGADKRIRYQGHEFVCDLFAAACAAFAVRDAERERLGLFDGSGVELAGDRPLLSLGVGPDTVLVLRPRIVRAR